MILSLLFFSRAYSDGPYIPATPADSYDSLHMYNALQNETPLNVLMQESKIN